MPDERTFVDYYEILKVEFGCDARELELAYHYFAKMYHPDAAETANIEKFTAVINAYKVLRNPKTRSAYDNEYISCVGLSDGNDVSGRESDVNAFTAVGDAEKHETILLQLYNRRRERALDAGIAGWLLQENVNCSEEQFEFHLWYLKSKGLIEVTEQGTMAITILGVDHVISTSKAAVREKLLSHRPDILQDNP